MRIPGLTLATLAALLLLTPGMASAEKKGAAQKSAKKAQCATDISTLYPQAAGADRFTMVIRINSLNDVKVYANADELTGGLKPRVRDRDIFLINTRFKDTDAAEEQEMATAIRAAFPCNRIFALNGLSSDPLSEGYIFALGSAPEVGALLLDWEKMDWETARQSEPSLPAWLDSPFLSMLPRLKGRLSLLANTVLANGANKRIGLVPFARDDWNLGMMARTIDRQAARISAGGSGFQSSQTQKSCQASGATGMQATTKSLFGQYKSANFKKIKIKQGKGKKPKFKFKRLTPRTNKLNLGVQISFTATPDPGHPDPVKSVGPSAAAACTSAAIFQKAGAILYWARPSDMDTLFADPRVCALRPSPIGIC